MNDQEAQRLIEMAVRKAFKDIRILVTFPPLQEKPAPKPTAKVVKKAPVKKAKKKPIAKQYFTKEEIFPLVTSIPTNAKGILKLLKKKNTKLNRRRVESHLYQLWDQGKLEKVHGTAVFYKVKSRASKKA